MTIGTTLYTLLRGKCVGEDMFGNRYYTQRRARSGVRAKRWVMYRGMPEASKVPPLWHAWLHYMVDELPGDLGIPHYDWQKDHLPNLTGTKLAYRPPGHLAAGGARDASTSDYQPWTPGGA